MTKNKNLSDSYKATYLQESDPEFGARVPASKKDRVADNHDSGKASANAQAPEKVKHAKEVPNAAKDAISAQCGHKGKHSDNKTLANSGCGEDALDGGVCD
jgi:hypothetical protein